MGIASPNVGGRLVIQTTTHLFINRYMKKKLKSILKGVRLSNGRTHMWVLDKATDRMVKIDYTDLGLNFFSKRNAN